MWTCGSGTDYFNKYSYKMRALFLGSKSVKSKKERKSTTNVCKVGQALSDLGSLFDMECPVHPSINGTCFCHL